MYWWTFNKILGSTDGIIDYQRRATIEYSRGFIEVFIREDNKIASDCFIGLLSRTTIDYWLLSMVCLHNIYQNKLIKMRINCLGVLLRSFIKTGKNIDYFVSDFPL